jgi:predicted transcriptional regulator
MAPKRTTARTPLEIAAAAAAAAPAARRITPIACSKGWKRRLYRDCLDRTRRARAQGATPDRNGMAFDLLRQHAIEIQVVSSWHNGENDTIFQSSSSSSREYLEIQEEAETSRMSIDEGCCDVDAPQHNDELGVAHYITEEELFDLMKEVEDEIDREEMLRHEQIFYMDQHDQRCLEEQVTEFEEWQQQRTMAPPLCPTCYEETVLQRQQPSDYSAYASYCCVHCRNVLPLSGVNLYNDMR